MGCEWGFGTWVNRLSLDFSPRTKLFLFFNRVLSVIHCAFTIVLVMELSSLSFCSILDTRHHIHWS